MAESGHIERVALMNRRSLLTLAGLTGLTMAVAVVSAAPRLQGGGLAARVETALAGMTWRFVGPYRGGRTLAVSGVIGNAKTFYLGAVDGGVWRTVDAGSENTAAALWHRPCSRWCARKVAQSDPGHHLRRHRRRLPPQRHLVRQWRLQVDRRRQGFPDTLGLEDSQHIPRLMIDPKNPDRVFLAALGHASGPNHERGVYRTLDGGKSWTQVLFKDDKTGAVDLSLDPADSNIVYAALYEQIRMPWGSSSGGPGSGLYKSTDGGDHWTQLTAHGLPDGVLGKINVAVGADSKTVYAQIEAKEGGLFVSKDAGATWTRTNDSDE